MGKVTFGEFWRRQRGKVPPVLTASLTGQTVVVIGGNGGIGFEAAKHFARMGPAKLVLACRSQTKGDAALSELARETGFNGAEVRLVDLGDFTSVVRFLDQFEAENQRLDVLICNAAINTANYKTSAAGWETTIQVNHLSNALISLRLLPLLNKTAEKFNTSPRLVIVASEVHFWSKIDRAVLDKPKILETLSDSNYCTSSVMFDRYNVSKLLNVLWARALASHLAPGSAVVIDSANPGYCVSSLRDNIPFWFSLVTRFLDLILGWTAEQGSRQLVWAALAGADDPNLRSQLKGAYVSDMKVTEEADWVFSADGQETERRLWDETIDILAKVDPGVRSVLNKYLVNL